MTPTQNQIADIKQKCQSFIKKGYLVYFGIAPKEYGSYPVVRIKDEHKEWNFCDPNWDIVSKQLHTLFMNKFWV